MPVSVTDQYETNENASLSKPRSYVAILRGTKSDFIENDGGTHDGTEKSGDTIQLEAGSGEGTWISPVYDSGLLTPFVMYDLVEWTETLNGGNISVYIRTGRDQNAIEGKEWDEVTNGTLRHKLGFRYYQIKIVIDNGL